MHIFVAPSRYDQLDDLLTQIRNARQRPAWRSRLFAGLEGVTTLSTLRVLRAVEQCERAGSGASIGDVADYMAVEHSTASRTVANVVAAGLLRKSPAADDHRRCALTLTARGRSELAKVTARRHKMVAEAIAHWPDEDVETLVALLERLVAEFERGQKL
jgi:DNA-binding MarR family transcriptional regulator